MQIVGSLKLPFMLLVVIFEFLGVVEKKSGSSSKEQREEKSCIYTSKMAD